MRPLEEVLREATQAHMAGEYAKAEYLYCRIIAHADDFHPAIFLLGTMYAQTGCTGRAITFLRRAIEIEPGDYNAMHNLAGAYRQVENREKSVYWNEKSLALKRDATVLSNLSGCYLNQGTPEIALRYADEALQLKPKFPEAGNHRALALLELGRFEEGWQQYDSRLDMAGGVHDNVATVARFTRRPYTVPMWTGQPVKLLAIHGEQGLGDEIMFLTCLKQLREKYQIGEIVIEAAARLVKLIANSTGCRVYGTHDELVAAESPDAYIAMGSLPRFVWPVVPNAYLRPTVEYGKGRKRRIGLSWFGGHMLTHTALRNTMVEDWLPLVDLDADVISLQYGPRAEEAAKLGIPHDAECIADLDWLAAMIRSCDLVISVCNTTVHMAGALGVPCLCLTPNKPAWRYGLTGDKMVWYDSVRLIRQGPNEGWRSVIARVREEAANFGFVPRAKQAVA